MLSYQRIDPRINKRFEFHQWKGLNEFLYLTPFDLDQSIDRLFLSTGAMSMNSNCGTTINR